jgi:predicted CoA-binding protein
MVTKKEIEKFFEEKKLAIAGVSRNIKKFGYRVFKDLTENGYEVYPVNPNTDTIDGKKCFRNVSYLPADVNSLLILTPRSQTDSVLRDAINKGITNIWVQQMSDTEETMRIAEEYQKEIIYKKCIYMFAEPVMGVHKFHRLILKLFGRLPK